MKAPREREQRGRCSSTTVGIQIADIRGRRTFRKSPLSWLNAGFLIPNKIANRGIYISGIRGLTQNAILEALEAETGAEFDVEHAETKGVREKALESLKEGKVGPAMMGLHTDSNFNPDNSSFADFWDKVENDLIGVKPVSVREAVKVVLKT